MPDTFYPAADVALRRYTGSETWQQAHDAASASDVYDTNAATSLAASYTSLGLVTRSLFTFDTASLPDDAVVTEATLTFTGSGAVTGSNGSVDLVAGTPASPTSIVAADFNDVGTTLLANQIALGSWNGSGSNVFTLNAAGLAAINLTGYTTFALRHSSDRLNSSPGSDNAVPGYFSEQTGTSQDPVLVVTWVIAKTASDSGTGSDGSGSVAVTNAATASDSGSATDTAAVQATVNAASGGTTYGDDFTDTDNTALTSHTPTGTNAHGSWAAFYNGTGGVDSLRVTSNRLFAYRSDGTAAVAEYRHSDSFTDGSVEADFVIVGSNGSGYALIGLRSSGAFGSPNCYRAWLDHGIVNGHLLKLQKVVAGTITDLGSYDLGSLSGTYRIKLTATGSALTVTVDGVTRITATDSSVTSAGVGHVHVYNATGTSTGTGVHLDNFAVTTSPTVYAQPTDSAAATETATAGQVVTSKSGSDSAAGTDTSATKALITASPGSPGTPLTRSGTSAQVLVTAAGTVGTSSAHCAFPVGTLQDDGKIRLVYRKATAHSSSDGKLVTKTSSDGGATWSSEIAITPHGGDERPGALRKLSTGRLILVYYIDDWTIGPPYGVSAWYRYSDDHGATWSSAATLASAFASNAVAPSDIVELPNGDLLCAFYGRTTYGASTWDLRVSRSTDHGATWADFASVITAGAMGGYNCVEPEMMLLDDGSVYMSFHLEDSITTAWYTRSTNSGSTWSTPARIGSFTAWNKGGLLRTPDNDLIFAYGPTNDAQYFRQSFNNGVTWGSAIAVLSSSTSPYVSDTYVTPITTGAAGASPNIGFAFSLETYGQNAAQIYWRPFSPGATAPSAGSGTDTGTGTDSAGVISGVGAIAKTASDSGSSTDTASGVAVTYRRTAFDTGIGTDSAGGSGGTPTSTVTRPFYAPLDLSSVTAPLDIGSVTAPLDMTLEV